MRKYLIDHRKRYVKANLHCHTTQSDGLYTPEKIKKLYKEKGYEVVAFTDHEIIFDNSRLNDEDFIALTATEYSITNHVTPVTDTYIDYNNWQMTFRDKKTIHFNLYAKNQHQTFHPACNINNLWVDQREQYGGIEMDGYERVLTKESINETIKRVKEAGFLIQLNHPDWSLLTSDDYLNMDGLWGLEIYNYGTSKESGMDYVPGIYDAMLRMGKNVCCTMGDDNHNWGDQLNDSFGGYDYIEVDEFNYENIMNSLEHKKFYCTSGPIIHDLYVEDGKVTVKCSEAINIVMNGYNRSLQHVWGENITEATFTLKENDVYFRITVRDANGKVAHTNAYFIKDLKDINE